ncbi:undecaprenyl-phosphate 4-deoxy-4-formamido-L-arabinose transferase [mine drainage metagenome]|uniref:Undecaprenyl-phosphate 4-deoxy-4-formamido-L-arabinose transferase n=1 Tax=mine drainage metagenome TaxID=410659 RepID=A0A1J5TD38_9ZZZZ
MPTPLTTSAVSIVVPAYNEAESLPELLAAIREASASASYRLAEVIVVDDGSTDGTWELLNRASGEATLPLRAIRLRRNCGKAFALGQGFRAARGDAVVTLDADLQDDPSEIGRMLAKLDEGWDLVSGWKQVRHDPPGKVLPSRFFNWVTSRVSGLRLHDFNCGFKAYRTEVVKSLDLYGELHRYIPVLADNLGYRVAEIPVRHRARAHGRSKYGWERLSRGMLDLFTVMATTRYRARPAHLFGGLGLALGTLGFLQLGYLTVLWLLREGPIGTRPLLFLGILCVLMGAQLVSFGLLAELFIRKHGATDGVRYVAERLGFPGVERDGG